MIPIQVYADTATAYWNGSCGKKITSRGYGYTADGTNHRNKTWKIRTVAADPLVYPLGSKLKITFPKHLSKYNGIYTVRDTGGRIKGKIIDIYLGTAELCEEFGRQKVKVKKL